MGNRNRWTPAVVTSSFIAFESSLTQQHQTYDERLALHGLVNGYVLRNITFHLEESCKESDRQAISSWQLGLPACKQKKGKSTHFYHTPGAGALLPHIFPHLTL